MNSAEDHLLKEREGNNTPCERDQNFKRKTKKGANPFDLSVGEDNKGIKDTLEITPIQKYYQIFAFIR